jgi:hypothetical protein
MKYNRTPRTRISEFPKIRVAVNPRTLEALEEEAEARALPVSATNAMSASTGTTGSAQASPRPGSARSRAVGEPTSPTSARSTTTRTAATAGSRADRTRPATRTMADRHRPATRTMGLPARHIPRPPSARLRFPWFTLVSYHQRRTTASTPPQVVERPARN